MASRPSPTFMIEQYGPGSPSSPRQPRQPADRPGGRSEQEPAQAQGRSPRTGHLPSLTTNLSLPLQVPPPPGSAPQRLLTPLSTVSLSSPFTTAQPHAFPSASTALSREQSPVAARMPSYNVRYNPSEWASGSRQPSAAARIERHDPEAGIAAPPPPYSPPMAQSPTEMTTAGIPTLQTQTPAGAAAASPADTVRSSMYARDASATQITTAALPPPPPRLGRPDAGSHSSLLLPKQRRPISVAGLSTIFAHDNQLRPDAHASAHPGLLGPPAAKRAASTGTTAPRELSTPASRASSQSRSTSRSSGWQLGMPLPGPPPGPPPAASRSSSSHAPREQTLAGLSPLAAAAQSQAHRVPLRAPMLSPMPQTPAGWTEDQPMRPAVPSAASATRSDRQAQRAPLHIRTANLGPSIPSQDAFPATEPAGETPASASGSSRPSFGVLARSTAFRDSSVKGLRERRTLRHSMQAADNTPDLSALSVNTNPWADAMLSATSTTHPSTFLSDPSQPQDPTERTSAAAAAAAAASPVVTGETPRSGRDHTTPRLRPDASDPAPLSSSSTPRSPALHKLKIPPVPRAPKTLPTPPLSQKAPESGRSLALSPSSTFGSSETDSVDKFTADSLQRHRDFLNKESRALTDEQGFQAFVDYIAVESVLRQRRHAAASLLDGRTDLDAVRKRIFNSADTAVQAFFHRTAGEDTPATSASSTVDDGGRVRPESTWWTQYQPALSPIASMSYDEMSSRGRSSSRWWESQAGSQTEAAEGRVRRSKRESKYMGLSTAMMQSSIDESDTPRNNAFGQAAQESEYPAEKADPAMFGVYDQQDAEPVPQSQRLIPQPSPHLLDVSRFITLPPPYPRHYPAVNNAHPVLSNYRVCVRAMTDLSEIQERRCRHALSVQALRSQHNEKLADARAAFKNNVQAQIDDGTISYADAAEAEEALRVDERKAEQATLKAEFDTLQDVVIGPLHDMLNGRLDQLSARIDELTERLFVDAQQQNPDQPQQEGDDRPELLEYLTQLKWMFEAREQIHKEIFDLLTERNDKYKAIVLLPYQQANNLDKVRDTEAFFVRDNFDRAKIYRQDALDRHEQLFNIIEDNVARGVDLQSSAFWDLAPGLLELLQQIPSDVARLKNIAIPEQEYLENPSYFRYPQQYLYTLLDHAEKSTYQFIEAQVNLHCLLHEVKTSLLLARCRLMEADERIHDRASPSPSSTKISDYRVKEEAVLTTELKQRVGIIEEQWMDAIGSQLEHTREQIKTYLEAQGAWEEVTRDD